MHMNAFSQPSSRVVRVVIAAVASAGLTTSCVSPPKSDIAPPANPGFGESMTAAVEVCQPDGERAYLARLVCEDGKVARFNRLGSYGPRHALPADRSASEQIAVSMRDPLAPGDVDYHVVDGYEVSCATSRRIVYLDMYHCHQPTPQTAPPGFTLR
jgi:hypothetical protein